MFWNKNRSSDANKSDVSVKLSNIETNICHTKYANLDIRRAVLDWRDQHVENVELHLLSELPRLYSALDEQTEKMSIQDIIKLKKYGKERIEPIFNDWVEQEVIYLIGSAQRDLSTIFTHALEYSDLGATLNQDTNSGHYTDATIAVAATGLGAAVVPVVTTFSITSVGGIMGAFGVTAIAWPVVIAGMTTILLLLALGGYKAVGLRARAIAKFRRKTQNEIENQVLGYNNEKDSIRRRLQLYIGKSAEIIISEIDK